MSGSHWRKFIEDRGGLAIAFFVAALFVIFVAWPAMLTQREIQDDASRAAEYYSENAQKQVASHCFGLSPKAETDCAQKIEDAAREAQRGEYDLASQQTMAVWTAVMGGVAVLGVALSGIGVMLVWTTFAETRKANAIANEALDGQLRPWVNFDASFVRLQCVDGILKLRAKTEFENVGTSPALYMTYAAELINERRPGELVFNHMPSMFEGDAKKHHDRTLFPGESWNRGFSAELRNVPAGHYPIMLILAVRYRSPYSKTYRYTCKIYDLRDLDNDDGLIELTDTPQYYGITMRQRDRTGGIAT